MLHFVHSVILRPGSEEVNSLFFDELSTVLETLVVLACPVVIGGDFIVKVEHTGDSGACWMFELLTCCDMVQHVKGPAHNRGNTRSCDNAIYLSVEGCRYRTRGTLLRSLAFHLQFSACRRIAIRRREARPSVVGVALTRRLCDGCWMTVNFPGHNTTTSMSTSCSQCNTVIRNVADRLVPPIVMRPKQNCSTRLHGSIPSVVPRGENVECWSAVSLNSQLHRLTCLGLFNTQPTLDSSKQEEVLA